MLFIPIIGREEKVGVTPRPVEIEAEKGCLRAVQHCLLSQRTL
jgi:hypothetical protein